MSSEAQRAGAGRVAGRHPGGARLGVLVPFLAFVLLLVVYEVLRDVVEPASAAGALAHAADVVELERSLGLFVEQDVQRWVHDVPGGRFVTTWFYTLFYVGGFILFFLWLWFRRRANFWFVFAWYWITNLLAVIGYWLYPLAPPRLADLGFEDTTRSALELGGSFSWFQPFRNEVAAMPSMHVGQALLYALALTWLLASPWRWLWWLWPAFMLLTVMATANHYWLDGAGGALFVAAGLGVALVATRPLGLARPWEGPPAEPGRPAGVVA